MTTPPASQVYFIASGWGGVVKIGVTRNVRVRLKELQVGNPAELYIARVIPGGAVEEAWLHNRFSEQRIRGEWFRWHEDMATILVPSLPQPPTKEKKQHFGSLREKLEDAMRLGLLDKRQIEDFRSLGMLPSAPQLDLAS